MSMHYFSCYGGPGAVSTKSAPGHVTLNLYFASGWICGSHSAVQGIWSMKCHGTIFDAQVGPVRFPKKHDGAHYDELVFLHPAGSVSHVVHFGASGPQNVNALLFMLGWAQ
jgi:hypothetical protein